MKHSYLRKSLILFFGLLPLLAMAQTPLQYQLNQQGVGDCAGSPVELSVSTSVRLATNVASDITVNTAISGGNVANDGGNAVSQRGVCWSTSPNPTTANLSTSDGSGLGNFSSNLTGLSPNTTYYVRAYAINGAGTFYGNEVSFITGNAANPTAHTCGAENVHNPTKTYGSMTDQDGNTYKTILIGTQKWMAENLKVRTYRNGDLIPTIFNSAEWSANAFILGMACWFNNDSITYDCPLGKLYNWYAIQDSRQVCPTGWHVPNDSEFSTLINYLGGSDIAGGKLKSSILWGCDNIGGSNTSGFSALPGGWRSGNNSVNSIFDFPGGEGFWWSSTGDTFNSAGGLTLGPCSENIIGLGGNTQNGFSVRCISDSTYELIQGSIESINCESSTSSASFIDSVSAYNIVKYEYTGGNGGFYTEQTINSVGVEGLIAHIGAGNFQEGFGELVITISGMPSGTGAVMFPITIGGQSCVLTFNSFPNIPPTPHNCGAENVHNPNLSYGSMIDQDGNTYKTIVIGQQEWMAENLNVSHYRNGDLIPNITDNSVWTGLTSGAWCYYNNDSLLECPYGKLYNWYTTVDPRGLCPANWHVPSDEEWNVLVKYWDPFFNPNTIGNQSSFVGGKLKSRSNQYWQEPNIGASNESGFSGLPGGNRIFNGVFAENYGAYWWTSNACRRDLNFGAEYIGRSCDPKHFGFSVRCIRD